MTRILSTGTLLLVLAGIAWSFPGCSDDESPVDAPVIGVDTSAQQDAPSVDTTASLPDAATDAAADAEPDAS